MRETFGKFKFRFNRLNLKSRGRTQSQMKTLIFLIVIFVACCPSSIAQSKLYYGIHSGASLAYLRGGDSRASANSNPRVGFTGGASFGIKASKLVDFQTELNFQSLGGRDDRTALIPIQNYKSYTLNYISIPLLAKLSIPNTGLTVCVGPQYGRLLSSKLRTRDGYFEQTNKLRNNDFSAVVGPEYSWHTENGNQFVVAGRYQFSVPDIDRFDDDLFIKNRAFIVIVGYRFR